MNSSLDVISEGLKRRHSAERRFRLYGVVAIGFAVCMLVVLLVTIIRPGISGFIRHEVRIDVDTAPIAAQLRANQTPDYYQLTNAALFATLPQPLIEKSQRHQFLALGGSFAAFEVKQAVLAHPKQWGSVIPVWIALSSNADMLLKGSIDRTSNMALRPVNDAQIAWIDQWQKDKRLRANFNTAFFTHGDSRAPEAAGFGGSIVGSLLTLFVCLGLALPIAIMAAITLEEFAGKSRAVGGLEIIINNLAAVPSIIYGLLGLSVFLQVLHLPRSSALVGGLTLSMLILPVMIIAARSAIRAVPPSMRQAATALGASPLQVVRHHVLPYAWPGIMTGTILSICRALGETAPLLMIGMVAFVADVPRGFTAPATAMPVEIYLWASSPEMGFVEKTSAGILVLLAILLLLNLGAITLRNRSQHTWH